MHTLAFRVTGILGTTIALLLSVGIAFAEEGSVQTGTIEASTETSAVTKTEEATRMEIQKDAREKMKAVTESAVAKRKAIASTTQAEIRDLRQAAKERMEAVRLETKERMQAQREQVKERVKDIQDTKRQQMVENLVERFEHLNTTWTDHFTKQLDRLTAIVEKIESRAATASANGKNIAAVTAAIQTAKNAIAVAQVSITAQVAKTYAPDTSAVPTTTEAATTEGQEALMKTLKASFKSLHETLFNDLFVLRDGPMKAARSAVQGALQSLSTIPGVDEDSTSSTTSTAQ